jgi:hypothetical protein
MSIHIISIHIHISIDIIVMRCCAALSVRHMTTARHSLPSLQVAIRFNRLIQSLSMSLLRHRHDQDHDHLMSIGGVGGYYLSHVCVSVPFPFSFCRLSSRLLLSCTPHPIILNLSHNRIDTVISYRIISIISYHIIIVIKVPYRTHSLTGRTFR